MGIFDSLVKSVFGNSFDNKIMKSISSPVFIKYFDKENEELSQLESRLTATKDEETRKKIEKDIFLQKYVYDGLSRVYFELKNSPVLFYGLYNIRLEQGDNVANIDFLIITSQFCCIIKSKGIQGSIEIDKHGSFSRWIKKGDKWNKEGVYSPIEQNRRAEIILKNIINSNFNVNIPVLSLVVFTNPKITINFKETPKDIEKKVIKLDLLNTKLRELVANTSLSNCSEVLALQIAETLKEMDSSSKFKKDNLSNEILNKDIEEELLKEDEKEESLYDDYKEKLTKALKDYRSNIAAENKVPPYYIYNNKELNRIIEILPKSKEELLNIKGFGNVKVEKYGEGIINIIKNTAN